MHTISIEKRREKVTTALPGRLSAGTCKKHFRQGLTQASPLRSIICSADRRICAPASHTAAHHYLLVGQARAQTPKPIASSAPSYHDVAESSKVPRRPGHRFARPLHKCFETCRSHTLETATLPPANFGHREEAETGEYVCLDLAMVADLNIKSSVSEAPPAMF
jgi:hypothetical protein